MADTPSVPIVTPTSSSSGSVSSMGGLGGGITPGAASGSMLKGGISDAASEAPPVDPAVKAKTGHPGASYSGTTNSSNSGLVADASGRYGEYKSADIRSSRPLPQQGDAKNAGDATQPGGGGKASDADRGAGRAFNEAAAKIKKEEEEKLAAKARKNTADLLAQKADLERRIDAGDKSPQTLTQKAQIDKALNLPEGHIGRH